MDTLIFQGGEVKSLGGNKIGGHLVLFTTKQDPDTSGDYFDADTDFDFEDGDRRSGYYNHGFDVKIGNNKIGTGTLSKDKIGVWLEAQLAERNDYAEAIMEMVKKGALGLSSGALSHLVRREAKNKSGTLNYVSHWPIGEWSGTPTPAEPRTLAVSIKTWAESLSLDRLRAHCGSPFMTPDEAKNQMRGEEPPDDPFGVTADLPNDPAAPTKGAAVSITTVRELERFLRDAGCSVQESKTVASRFTLRDVEPEPITLPAMAEIDPAAKQARELRILRTLNRFEGLSLAAL